MHLLSPIPLCELSNRGLKEHCEISNSLDIDIKDGNVGSMRIVIKKPNGILICCMWLRHMKVLNINNNVSKRAYGFSKYLDAVVCLEV